MIFRSFHDSDYRGFFVRLNDSVHFVSDEEVDRADGSIYKALINNPYNPLPVIDHRSAYFDQQFILLMR